MYWYLLLPGIFFLFLFCGEVFLPKIPMLKVYHRWDWLLNLSGFIIQGAIIPLCGYAMAVNILPSLLPFGKGILPLGWYGAFLLNFIGVDFLYYWQHRAMHEIPWAWQWHRCHHASPRVDIWATARNTILTNFFFVYLLLNPLLGFLCNNPAGFFAGAALTASLDLLRHTCIDFTRIPLLRTLHDWLGRFLVMPSTHHRHHDAEAHMANFGANLIIWDKLFGTLCNQKHSSIYQDPQALSPAQQLFYPIHKG